MSIFRRRCLLVAPFVGLCCAPLVSFAIPAVPLQTAEEVLTLSAADASMRLTVDITGVVTAAEPDWNGQFFIQDATGGVFVENLGRPAPMPGDRITVHGVSHPGAFAPIVSAPEWTRLGSAPLPDAQQVRIDDLNTGAKDGERVEIVGVVRTARTEPNRLLIDLSVTGHRLQVQGRVPAGLEPATLIGARVRVRGTAATRYIGGLRHLASVALYAPRLEDLAVVEPAPGSAWEEPIMPINRVAQYRRNRQAEQRVHVRGTVTLQRPGEGLFLQDATGGLRVLAVEAEPLALDDEVEAVGFLEYESHLPLLRDATTRRLGTALTPVLPKQVSFVTLMLGEHHGDLVTVRGRILDRSIRPETGGTDGPERTTLIWMVQHEGRTFAIELPLGSDDRRLLTIPVESTIECDGVCAATADATGKLTSLRILVPRPADVRVLVKPSWFTPARLLAGVALLSIGLVAVLGWLLTIAKKNAMLHRVVRELEEAKQELQEAHDTLEEKVAERSAQLQVEMTARKTAELQFKAVLAERTRLARDLHDTLEQTLAGIALRLNTAAKLAPHDPEASDIQLQFARNWLHQSQVDLRRSIWDLRSRELEQFDLASALRHSADQLVEGTEIALEFHASGPACRLPEVLEENLLRIAQEALTNIAKHATASRVEIRLSFALDRVTLEIVDNGVGFDPARPAKDGHFGVVGMRERIKRVGGTFSLTSAPRAGTRIVIEVPLTSETNATIESSIHLSPR